MNPVLRMTLPPSRDPAHRAYSDWAAEHYSPDVFSAFMAAFKLGRAFGHKEGYVAGCESVIGVEPKVPTVDELRAQLKRAWAPRRLRDLLGGKR